jgi:outer membrane lipoprotein carrier protein
MKPFVVLSLAVSLSAAAQQSNVQAIASRVDDHYNHLNSLRASYTEHYSGMGQQRTEQGTLLLKKPGRMRWMYQNGKVFVLDSKFAISYTPGDAQAERVPAKQLDDMRSPLRFLLGHTKLTKELDHVTVTPAGNGTVTLTGTPHYEMSPGDQRVQTLAVTVVPSTGAITALKIQEIDGTTTEFDFYDMQENVPTTDSDFRFQVPAGVTVVDGMPPA